LASSSNPPPENPFKAVNDQYLSSIKWLIGALAGIAALMVAGTQLSSLGVLRWPEDQGRIVAAGASFGLVLVFVVVALGLLAYVQMPGPGSDIERLHNLAAAPAGSDLRTSVQNDPSYHRGTGSLKALLECHDKALRRHVEAERIYRRARLNTIRRSGTDPAPLLRREEVAKSLLDLRLDEYRNYRQGVRMASWLDNHTTLRHRSRGVTGVVLILTLLSCWALAVFAWAANPPADSTGAAALRTPTAAKLILASDAAIWDARLGKDCATAARGTDGVPVVALSSSDDSVEVVLLPEGSCSSPARLVVPKEAGTVTAGPVVAPPEGR
jgi:hypothetical protein